MLKRFVLMVVGVIVVVGCLPVASEAADLFGPLRKKFYLTPEVVTGAGALTACQPGYHMASLWEIFNPSVLVYDNRFGFMSDDSGAGPPTTADGWVRTGYDASVLSSPGIGNCNLWTASDGVAFGSSASLSQAWATDPPNATHPWKAGANPCNSPRRVWCISD